ncbi:MULTISPECIES: glycosyltransferase [Pyrococcus]|uniref:glycosyltransferase n=1 Tax=Pyrococcus TaxID=2260 RepID=UPI001CB778BE|nr:glycosyltransferase [Pyrococcus furiosus]
MYFASKLLLKFKGKFDIIDCQEFSYLSCLSAKFHSVTRKIPLVITWHELWKDYWRDYLGGLGKVGEKIEILTSKLTTYNVSVSRLTQKRLMKLGVRSAFSWLSCSSHKLFHWSASV